MFAVIETGGKQYKVEEGDEIIVEKIEGKKGKKIEFPVIIAATSDDKVVAGEKDLKKITVEGKIMEHLKGDKVIIFKYKPRKRYRRKTGHRQNLTKVKIINILGAGKKEKKKTEKKETKKPAVKTKKTAKTTKEAAKKTEAKKDIKKTAVKKAVKKPDAKKTTAKKVVKKTAAGTKKETTKKTQAKKTTKRPAAKKTTSKKAAAKKSTKKK